MSKTPRRHARPVYEEISRVRDSMYGRLAIALTGLGTVCVMWLLFLDLSGAGPPIRTAGATVVSLGSLLPLLFKRETRVQTDAIHLKFDWVNRGKVEVPLGEIRDHHVATVPPSREWSQQESQDAKKVRVLWAQEKQGVLLTLKDGRRIFVASSHPSRLNRAVATAIRHHRGIL